MSYLNTKANKRKLAANRYRNARYVLFERCSGELARFARTLQQSHSYASAYISESPHKRLGEKVARAIESAFDLNPGWLDEDHSASWDRRLREAIGGSVHPLDGEAVNAELAQEHRRWLSSLTVLPESGDDLLRLSRECQLHLQEIQQQLETLSGYRRDLLSKAQPLYQTALEDYLLQQDYVVKPPSYDLGQVFQVWHHEPSCKICLQLRIQLTFEPVMQLIPVPPVSQEVIVMPLFDDALAQVRFLFIAADARSAPFDVTRLRWQGEKLWLMNREGERQRELTDMLSLEPLFQH